MAPRATQGAKKSVSGPNQGADATVSASKEKPAKRPRTSTISNVEGAEDSSTVEVNSSSEATVEAATATAKSFTEDDKPKLVGSFDLYGMELPFLNKIYSPAGSDDVFPEKLYKEILSYQAKNDRTVKITIPENFASGKPGQLRTSIFCDPMVESPFDIAITDMEEVKASELDLDLDYDRPSDEWTGPGLQGDLQIEDPGCGIASSYGEISLRPLWKKVDKKGKVMELFEGSFSFKVVYSGLYSRKGHGKGQDLAIAFWAVRGVAA